MKKVFITGAAGMLGRDLIGTLAGKYEIIGVSHSEMDVTQEAATRHRIREAAPDVIVHTAAFTQVDACESEPEKAFQVNGLGTRNVALGAKEAGARLLTVSTDYVFDGKKQTPYRESDPPAPLGVYGKSKYMGEQEIRNVMTDFLIIRASWLFGRHGPNFVKTVLRLADQQPSLKVVDDQRGSPTYTIDLADAIRRLIETDASGIVHVSNSGSCSWREFAVAILQRTGREDRPVLPISTEQLGRPAPRPANSVLDNARYESLTGHRLRPWEEALSAYLRETP